MDIWNAAGSPSNKRANDWARLPITDELIDALYKQNTGKSRIKGKSDLKSIIYFKRGKGGLLRASSRESMRILFMWNGGSRKSWSN